MIRVSITYFILCFSLIQTQAQDFYEGVVMCKGTNEPISFEYILSNNGHFITYANEDGRFRISDTIVGCFIYCMGYESALVDTLNDHKPIYYLTPKHYSIDELLVHGAKLYPYTKTLQKVKIRPWTKVLHFYATLGSIRTRLIFGNGDQGRLNKVLVYVTEINKPNSYFRIKLYENNGGEQGREVTPVNIIGKGKANKYAVLDVSEFNIVFPPDGLFIGVETIDSGNQPFVHHWGVNKDVKGTYYGPSLGSVYPDRESKEITYFYNSHTRKWVREDRSIPLIAAEVKYFRKKK